MDGSLALHTCVDSFYNLTISTHSDDAVVDCWIVPCSQLGSVGEQWPLNMTGSICIDGVATWFIHTQTLITDQ